ncbi:MAG TPA: HNH endonuclease [Candidatus Saccharimonadales bacterium]|jgi:hypothetical protein|nr:HNH endonuclease [Candidatus Saccharimonadales bacterium]
MTEPNNTSEWLKMRSNVYIRDKGICWICNTFVELKDYDLGHLIDRSMGGDDAYDNLVVMHTFCNGQKPLHKTLEECLKWRLLLRIPQNNENPEIPKYYANGRRIYKQAPSKLKLQKRADKRALSYQEQLAKIKPCTVCWIQGYPTGGAMWHLLPPPYRKEDGFTMRQTPPDATIPEGQRHGVIETLQVINGKLEQDIDFSLGIIRVHIHPTETGISVSFPETKLANIGERQQTIGMGKGQIPIKEWQEAKTQGIGLLDFKSNYRQAKPLFYDI